MRIAWPLALLALLIVPLAVLGYLWLERRRARYAIHYTNIDVLASVAGGTRRWRALVPPILALLALTFAVAALARPEARVSVASEQTSIALVARRIGLDVRRRRQADATRRRAGGGPPLPRPAPDQVPRRPRDLLLRAVRRLAAHARPRARAGGTPVRDVVRPGNRDRRCAGPFGRAAPARRRSTTGTAPRRQRRRRPFRSPPTGRSRRS